MYISHSQHVKIINLTYVYITLKLEVPKLNYEISSDIN